LICPTVKAKFICGEGWTGRANHLDPPVIPGRASARARNPSCRINVGGMDSGSGPFGPSRNDESLGHSDLKPSRLLRQEPADHSRSRGYLNDPMLSADLQKATRIFQCLPR